MMCLWSCKTVPDMGPEMILGGKGPRHPRDCGQWGDSRGYRAILSDLLPSKPCLSFSCSDSPLPVSSRVCFVKFHDPDSAVVAQHLTNTVFVDRALIVVPYAEGLWIV